MAFRNMKKLLILMMILCFGLGANAQTIRNGQRSPQVIRCLILFLQLLLGVFSWGSRCMFIFVPTFRFMK